MKTKLTIALAITVLLCGCDARHRAEPTAAGQFIDSDGKSESSVSLSLEEMSAYGEWKEWKRTNITVITISYMAIRESEYRELTNWINHR